jgi:hypothetical protein
MFKTAAFFLIFVESVYFLDTYRLKGYGLPRYAAQSGETAARLFFSHRGSAAFPCWMRKRPFVLLDEA